MFVDVLSFDPYHRALQNGSSSNNKNTNNNNNSSTNASIAIIRTLLEAGCYPSPGDSQGNTPLHYAAYQGDYELVELLIRYKAHVNAKNIKQGTALHMAASQVRIL